MCELVCWVHWAIFRSGALPEMWGVSLHRWIKEGSPAGIYDISCWSTDIGALEAPKYGKGLENFVGNVLTQMELLMFFMISYVVRLTWILLTMVISRNTTLFLCYLWMVYNSMKARSWTAGSMSGYLLALHLINIIRFAISFLEALSLAQNLQETLTCSCFLDWLIFLRFSEKDC